MTIRSRMTLWYAAVLIVSLLIISIGTYRELDEQIRRNHQREPGEGALDETSEMIFWAGLPAVLFGVAGGWWLTRRALAPVTALASAAEKIHERNLRKPLPRTGNGDELDRLTEVLNRMTARLDDSFTRIREFTLHASHELKTPLTVLHGELDSALQNQSLSASERDRLLSQLDEVQRLSKIVDGLTLLTKADAGQIHLNFEPLHMNELVTDAYADAQILARDSGVTVNLRDCETVTLRGDRHRLRQLLLNLTDNAIKYNHPQGTVDISLRFSDNRSAEITIINTGDGISQEGLPRIFDHFFRGDASHSSDIDGCGLGLSIAQWIVNAHNGKIAIASEPGKVTTVVVTLPLSRAET